MHLSLTNAAFIASNGVMVSTIVYGSLVKYYGWPFTWHPIAVAGVMSSTFSGLWLLTHRKQLITDRKRKWAWSPQMWHEVAMWTGAGFAAWGTKVMWDIKADVFRSHFETIHDYFAWATLVLMGAVTGSATLALHAPQSLKNFANTVAPLHAPLGKAYTLLAFASAVTGTWSTFRLGGRDTWFRWLTLGSLAGIASTLGAEMVADYFAPPTLAGTVAKAAGAIGEEANKQSESVALQLEREANTAVRNVSSAVGDAAQQLKQDAASAVQRAVRSVGLAAGDAALSAAQQLGAPATVNSKLSDIEWAQRQQFAANRLDAEQQATR